MLTVQPTKTQTPQTLQPAKAIPEPGDSSRAPVREHRSERPCKPRKEQLVDQYASNLRPEQQRSLAQAKAAIEDGAMFRKLYAMTPPERFQFFDEHPDFFRQIVFLREINNAARLVDRHQTSIGQTWDIPNSDTGIVPVLTSHPTHSRDTTMRQCYADVSEWLDSTTGIELTNQTLTGILPPEDHVEWKKPDLIKDEIPMVAKWVANHANALFEELHTHPNQQSKDRILKCVHPPEIWGAYDQDGHPDARPGGILIQRAHLRLYMWQTYSAIAEKLKLSPEIQQKITATVNYWRDATNWLVAHADELAEKAILANHQRGAGPIPDDVFDVSTKEGYPAIGNKLGKTEDEAAEKAAFLKLLGDGQEAADLCAVVEKYGTSGAKGHFRFTASGKRGIWPSKDSQSTTANEKALRDLELRFAEISALHGDVNMVIIAECESGEQFQKTVELLRKQGIALWVDQPGGIIVNPLIESKGMTNDILNGMKTELENAKVQELEIHVMFAGSDLVNREGKVGAALVQRDLIHSAKELRQHLLELDSKKFTDVTVRIMEGAGGSAVRTGGAPEIIEIRDSLRFMGEKGFNKVAITKQGIRGDSDYGSPRMARHTHRGDSGRPALADSNEKTHDAYSQFLSTIEPFIGRYDGKPLRSFNGYQSLYKGNPVIDAATLRVDGSRSPIKGTPSKGFGDEGERTIMYAHLVRLTGALFWHHDWRKIPSTMLNDMKAAWIKSDHPLHKIVKLLVAEMAVELTRTDITLAEEIFSCGDLSGDKRIAFDELRQAHEHLFALLKEWGVFENQDSDGLLVPTPGPVLEALKSELGLDKGCDRNSVIKALDQRRWEHRLHVKLRLDSLNSKGDDRAKREADMLLMSVRRYNEYDGPAATDFSSNELSEYWNLPLHFGPVNQLLQQTSRSGINATGQIELSRDGWHVLGPGLLDHEMAHVDSGKVKHARQIELGEIYNDLHPQFVARQVSVDTSAKELNLYMTYVRQYGQHNVNAKQAQENHARAELQIAKEQQPIGEGKLQRLSQIDVSDNADRQLTVAAEQAVQSEKLAIAKLTQKAIENLLDNSEGQQQAKANLAVSGVRNEVQFLLSRLTGTLIGVPSHTDRATGKSLEEVRAFISVLSDEEFDQLKELLPDCDEEINQLQRAQREVKETRANLLVNYSQADKLAPTFGRASN